MKLTSEEKIEELMILSDRRDLAANTKYSYITWIKVALVPFVDTLKLE
jgi:hypothetical protein